VDDRSGCGSFSGGPALAGLRHHLRSASRQRRGRILEEHQAGNAIAALKAKLALTAKLKRDGKWITSASRELVPGDVIRVRLGEIVPADARLLEGDPWRWISPR